MSKLVELLTNIFAVENDNVTEKFNKIYIAFIKKK